MRKAAFSIAAAIALCLAMTSCNKQVIDTALKYDRAIICLPDGEIVEGELESWRDYADGDQLQVKVDGKTYLVHSANAVLIDD